jgi:hypothetical protein
MVSDGSFILERWRLAKPPLGRVPQALQRVLQVTQEAACSVTSSADISILGKGGPTATSVFVRGTQSLEHHINLTLPLHTHESSKRLKRSYNVRTSPGPTYSD